MMMETQNDISLGSFLEKLEAEQRGNEMKKMADPDIVSFFKMLEAKTKKIDLLMPKIFKKWLLRVEAMQLWFDSVDSTAPKEQRVKEYEYIKCFLWEINHCANGEIAEILAQSGDYDRQSLNAGRVFLSPLVCCFQYRDSFAHGEKFEIMSNALSKVQEQLREKYHPEKYRSYESYVRGSGVVFENEKYNSVTQAYIRLSNLLDEKIINLSPKSHKPIFWIVYKFHHAFWEMMILEKLSEESYSLFLNILGMICTIIFIVFCLLSRIVEAFFETSHNWLSGHFGTCMVFGVILMGAFVYDYYALTKKW